MTGHVQTSHADVPRRRRLLRVAAIWICSIILLGLIGELFNGMSLLRAAPSAWAWVAGIFVLGCAWAFAELTSEWIWRHDKVSDPLWKRSFRLIAWLFFGLFIMLVLLAVYGMLS